MQNVPFLGHENRFSTITPTEKVKTLKSITEHIVWTEESGNVKDNKRHLTLAKWLKEEAKKTLNFD